MKLGASSVLLLGLGLGMGSFHRAQPPSQQETPVFGSAGACRDPCVHGVGCGCGCQAPASRNSAILPSRPLCMYPSVASWGVGSQDIREVFDEQCVSLSEVPVPEVRNRGRSA